MSEIIRYERAPGVHSAVVELPEGYAVILTSGVQVGDPVYPPEEVGGGMRRVAAITHEACPGGCGKSVPFYAMSGDDGLLCAECTEHRFMWCLRRTPRGGTGA